MGGRKRQRGWEEKAGYINDVRASVKVAVCFGWPAAGRAGKGQEPEQGQRGLRKGAALRQPLPRCCNNAAADSQQPPPLPILTSADSASKPAASRQCALATWSTRGPPARRHPPGTG